MKLLARSLLLCACSLGACNSSKDLNGGAKDEADAAQTVASHDASTADATQGGANTQPHDASQDAARASTSDASAGGSTWDAGANAMTSSFVYVGGYGTPYPVRTYSLDRASGTLTQQGGTVELGESPTYIAASADRRFLYLANESDDNGGVTVASVATNGALSRLGQQHAAGALVFTSLDPAQKFVLTASYNGGFAAVFPISSDRSVGAAVDTESFAKPSGASSAQTHSIRTHPSGKWAYVPNKARNEIAQFALDGSTGKLAALSPATVQCAGGPRMIAFSKAGDYAYLMTELSSELVVYEVGSDGKLRELQRLSGLPQGQTGNAGAHVLVHPNDKFVYASNRTDNSIGVFARGDDGKLSPLGFTKTMGTIPRHFDIDSAGQYLIVANSGDMGKANGSVVTFAIGNDGLLTQHGSLLSGIESPAAIAIVTQ